MPRSPKALQKKSVARYEPLRWLMPATAVTGCFAGDSTYRCGNTCTPRDGCPGEKRSAASPRRLANGCALGYQSIRLSGNSGRKMRHVQPLDSVGGALERRSGIMSTGMKR